MEQRRLVAMNAPSLRYVRELLEGHEVYGTTLLVLALDRYGKAAIFGDRDEEAWHPAVLRMELEDDFGAAMSREAFDRLMAAIATAGTDLFYKNVRSFVQLANVLSGSPFDPTGLDLADPLECAWAVTEAALLNDGDEDRQESYAPAIKKYVRAMLRREGYCQAPPSLRPLVGSDYGFNVASLDTDDADALVAHQNELMREVEDVVRENLTELVEQVRQLPLQHAKASPILQRAAASFQKA